MANACHLDAEFYCRNPFYKTRNEYNLLKNYDPACQQRFQTASVFFFSRPVTHTTVNLADRKFGVNWGAGVNWLGSRKQGAPG